MGQAVMTGHDLLARLLETLGALRLRTQSFADLLTSERQAIRTLATDQLISLNQAKLRLLKELSTYEDVRKGIVEQLATLWKIPVGSMTMASIADRVGGPIADQLKQQQTQLNHSILTMKRSNQVTGAVLQKSLTFLHEAISVMRAPFQVQLSLYSESGSIQAPALEGGLLERRG
jgi:flagellar biosynthesis/type III secretory pathway chaperone